MNNKDVAATVPFHACSILCSSSARLPQGDGFSSSMTRKTYLHVVPRPGDLLFEIYLRDKNSHFSFLIFCVVLRSFEAKWLTPEC